MLEAISTCLVENTLALYHEHAFECRDQVDELLWKKVRQTEDIQAFKESSNGIRPVKPATHQIDGERVTRQLMGVGTFIDNVDDDMFNVLNPTTEAMRIKLSYSDDGFLDGADQATLVQSSHTDPLWSFTLRWRVKRNLLLINGVLRLRDVMYLGAAALSQVQPVPISGNDGSVTISTPLLSVTSVFNTVTKRRYVYSCTTV